MLLITRRTFTYSLAASIAAPAIVKAAPSSKRPPIAFSTLGRPAWEWKTILDQAAQHGFAAIEMRGLMGEMDLPKSPQFTGAKLKESLKDIDALELKISGLGDSTNMREPDAAKRAKQMDEAKRFVDWEKRWRPEIEEPEIAIPHYAKVMRQYLAEAGIKA
ncbi:MAG: hypothetical protein ACREA2_19495 [Blastocatellia bacterium]